MALQLYSCQNSTKNSYYGGEDILNFAQIIRDRTTKATCLKIDTGSKWALYSGLSVESVDFSKPLLKGKGSGTFTLDVPDSVRSYFQLVTTKGTGLLAENHLPMTGGYNFRDLGGIRTKEGRFVKWGKIFRSDGLDKLTDQDLRYLSSIPIVSIVDFRSSEEKEQAPDRVPSSTVRSYAYPVFPGNFTTSDLSRIDSAAIDSLMAHINTLLVTDSIFIKRYKDLFMLLQNRHDVPLLFHCSAGKDRTGMGAALILFALGVDEETVMQDYLASNVYLGDKYNALITKHPELKSLMEVKKEYLKAAINHIIAEHGAIENYLTGKLEVDIPKFREMYLYE